MNTENTSTKHFTAFHLKFAAEPIAKYENDNMICTTLNSKTRVCWQDTFLQISFHRRLDKCFLTFGKSIPVAHNYRFDFIDFTYSRSRENQRVRI